MTVPPFYSIGHGTRAIGPFLDLLRAAGIAMLIDIRRFPMSRHNPQFNSAALAASLAAAGLSYGRIEALGGRRGRVAGMAADVNGWWENESFHHYADYALTAPFRAGFAELLAIGRQQKTAFMCSETVWWRCHRRIVTDHLLARGEKVFHIMEEGHVEEASLSKGAVPGPDGDVRYPAPPPAEPGLFPA